MCAYVDARRSAPRAAARRVCLVESRFRERVAPAGPVSDDAVEFVRFCYRRRKVGWPELYDEMCAVAGRGLFRGWRADELSAEGIGFSLFEMPALAALVQRVLAEEYDRGSRSPVAVVRAMPAETAADSEGYGTANDDGPIAGEATDVRHIPLRLARAAAGA
jgi:hypothetical protein